MRRLFLALLLLLLAATAVRALDVPQNGGQWVVDTAQLLPQGEKDALGASLRAYAEQSGNQIVVLTIPGL